MANPQDTTVDDELLAKIDQTDDEPTDGYSEEELERLTDAERAALLGEDDETADDDPAAQQAPVAPAPEPDPAPTPAAATDLAEIEGQIAALTAQQAEKDAALTALRGAYDDGEITADEFDRQQKALAAEVAKIAREAGALEGKVAGQREADDRAWVNACRSFLSQNPAFQDPAHSAGLNAEVEAVTADPRFAALSFDQQLTLAAQRYALTVPDAGPSVGASPAPAPAKAPAGRTPGKLATEPPPTLATVPAETIDPNESNIAALAARLDRTTDPTEKERIMARIPEEMLDQVLAYGG